MTDEEIQAKVDEAISRRAAVIEAEAVRVTGSSRVRLYVTMMGAFAGSLAMTILSEILKRL